MAATWPASLPSCFVLGSFTEQPPDLLLKSSMDIGPQKIRRRTTAGVRPVTGRLMLTTAEVAILDAFIRDDLHGGALPFDMPVQSGGGTWLVRFTEMPRWTRVSTKYSVDISLEVLP